MQAVILAGGLATRMRPHTLTLPKAMIEVAGRPFADWLLERLARAGYDDAVFCIGYLGEQIAEHVGDGARFGLRVRYADEGKNLLGTGGALRAAAAAGLLDDAFLVTYGDSYLPFDYAEPLALLRAHEADCDGVMSVYRNASQWDASNVKTDGSWVTAYEKGTRDPAFDHIDYGALALKKSVLGDPAWPAGAFGLDVVQHEIAARRRMRAVVARDRFFEIGSHDGLATLDAYLRSGAGGVSSGGR